MRSLVFVLVRKRACSITSDVETQNLPLNMSDTSINTAHKNIYIHQIQIRVNS